MIVLKNIFKMDTDENLIIELPEYKIPNINSIGISIIGKIKEYLNKVGSTIFIFSIIVWMMLNFGPNGYTKIVNESFGYLIGIKLECLFKIAGIGYWQIIISLLSGLAGKELIVSTLKLTTVSQNIINQDNLLILLNSVGFGKLNAFAFMVFCLLYTPCMATIGTIKKETNSLKFAIFLSIFQFGFAICITTLIYQVGNIFV